MNLQNKTNSSVKSLILIGFYICLITLSLNLIFFIVEIIDYPTRQPIFQFITSHILASAIVFSFIGYVSIRLYSLFLLKSKYRNLYKIVISEVIIGSSLFLIYFYSGLS